jgi:hypothetical protein
MREARCGSAVLQSDQIAHNRVWSRHLCNLGSQALSRSAVHWIIQHRAHGPAHRVGLHRAGPQHWPYAHGGTPLRVQEVVGALRQEHLWHPGG